MVHSGKFSILNLSSLHSSGKPYLGKPGLDWTVKLAGYGPQLLGDSLGWSDYESDRSALFTPADKLKMALHSGYKVLED